MSPEADPPPLDGGWDGDPSLVAFYRRLVTRARVEDWASEPADTPATSLADDDSEKKLHDNLSTISIGALDRSRDGAKFVETAAAALVTLYTGILGVVFVASDKPMPARGLYAAILFGIAIVGTAYYLAYVRVIPPIGRISYTTSRPENIWLRTEWLASWTSHLAGARSGSLHAAVVALAFGVAFMPAAFLPERLPNPIIPIVSPSPTAAAVWPTPQANLTDPALAKVLYKAQVDQFASGLKDQAASGAAGGTNTNDVLAAFFVIALLVTFVVANADGLRRFLRGARGSGGPQPPTDVLPWSPRGG